MQYKKSKLAFAAMILVSLTACANNNNNNALGGPRNVANKDLTGPRNVSTGDLKRPLNVSNPNRFSTTEIQPMNNGFITIDQNSYSTTTPSHQFPHSKRVGDGQFWYYRFEPELRNQTGKIQQPRTGVVTPPKASTPAAPETPPAQQPSGQTTDNIGTIAMQVIDLTNKERQKNGLPPLKADPSLTRVAQTKTNDMNAKHYFSHTSPTYGSPFDMMRDFGVTYRTAGENIAMGQPTAQQVVNAWMNSEGHRKNILSPNYTNIGVGYTKAGNYWAQMFIGK
ncbi:CAP domain-containing protein [Bacillota bacterium Lsc_1132]